MIVAEAFQVVESFFCENMILVIGCENTKVGMISMNLEKDLLDKKQTKLLKRTKLGRSNSFHCHSSIILLLMSSGCRKMSCCVIPKTIEASQNALLLDDE